jgi:beta-phosphoglucomutase-like phosphatase (HAD superfamily)
MRRWMGVVVLLGSLLQGAAAQATPVTEKILEDVKTAYAKQERPVVVFDLEGTVFDNRPRILQILKEYADQDLKSVRPEAAQKISALTPQLIQYMLADTLQKAGVTEEAVVNNAAVFWSQRFFADDYLRYDAPVPGAVNFVRALYSAGARIVYLSGRDAPRQLIGTVRALRDHGFPIGIQGTELILKPSLQVVDAQYKQQATNYLRHFGKVIAAFDTEPANVNVYKRAFADASVILVSAPHTPNAPPLLAGIELLDKFE